LPLGAWARFEGGELVLDAVVLSADGTESVRGHGATPCENVKDAVALGSKVAKDLLDAGAEKILKLAGRPVGRS